MKRTAFVLFCFIISTILCVGCTKESLPSSDTRIREEYFEVTDDGGIIFIAENYDGDGNITIPEKLNGIDVTYVAERAFDSAENIKSINIGENITQIGNFAFVGSSIETVNIANSVEKIGSSAFRACSDLVDITLSENISVIPQHCFNYCTKLESITLPLGLESIEDAAFDNCSHLSSIIIPDKVKSIGNLAFNSCTELESVEFGAGVSYIGENAFVDCDTLEEIVLPYGFSEFGQYAFWMCDNLRSVTIPDTVEYIGYYAFASCGNLSNVYYAGSEEQFEAINIDPAWKEQSPNIIINYDPEVEGYLNTGTSTNSNEDNPYRQELSKLEEEIRSGASLSIDSYESFADIDESDDSYWYAVSAAQSVVKDYMKYPDDCNFPVSADEYTVKRSFDDYIVFGTVGAKNDMGAVKNTAWAVTFTMIDYSGIQYQIKNYKAYFSE